MDTMYTIVYDGINSRIVMATSADDNMSYVMAKKVLLTWMRGRRDQWAQAVRDLVALEEENV